MSATVPVGAGASQAATLRVTSEYLCRDNMHFRPLSARVFHLINYSANELFYSANERPALAVPLKALAYATSYSGMTLNCIVALLEGLATKYHLADAVLLNVQSFISTAAAHFIFGNIFNTIAGREPSRDYAVNFLNDTFAIAFEDLLRAARNDRLMGEDRAGGVNNDFFARFPRHRESIERFFNRRARDPVLTGEEMNRELLYVFRDFVSIPLFQDVLRDYVQYLGITEGAV